MNETIQHAAIQRPSDGLILLGKHHGKCYWQRPVGELHNCLQGFVTSEGRFVSREEAGVIAFAAGQIDEDPKGAGIFSEDFWCTKQWYNGKYDYDEEKGYILKQEKDNE